MVKKLGWGEFSTVWLAWDLRDEQFVALKISKSAADFRKASTWEIRIFEKTNEKLKGLFTRPRMHGLCSLQDPLAALLPLTALMHLQPSTCSRRMPPQTIFGVLQVWVFCIPPHGILTRPTEIDLDLDP